MTNYFNNFRQIALLLSVSAGLTACGGDSNSNGGSTGSVTPPPPVTTPAPEGSAENPIVIELEKAVRNINQDESVYYAVDVPEDQASLVISFAWSEDAPSLGDPDIFVSFDKTPSIEESDCRSEFGPGESEVCVIDNPQAGRYHILVYPFLREGVKAGEFEVNDATLYATTDLFKVHHACEEADIDFRAQSMTDTQIAAVCAEMATAQIRFANLFNDGSDTLPSPVEGDLNDRVTAEVYADIFNHTTWMSYLRDSSNSSGIFFEGYPTDPNSVRAELHAFNGLHWTGGLTHYWNLRHEFMHYLDGRYNKAGNYGTTVNHRITWWSEGLAEYLGFDNGPMRRFNTAYDALFPTPNNVLDCETGFTPYEYSIGNRVDGYSIVNNSDQTLTLRFVLASGEVTASSYATLENGDSWTGGGFLWNRDDRFVLQNAEGECVSVFGLRENVTVAYQQNGTTTAVGEAEAYDINGIVDKDGSASPYQWGQLLVAFLIDEESNELQLQTLLNLMRNGQFDEVEILINTWVTEGVESQFRTWLEEGIGEAFEASYEEEANQLTLGSYITINGVDDWGFKLSLAEDVDSLTIGAQGGSGWYTLLIGDGKPVHHVANYNKDALLCEAEDAGQMDGPDMSCTLSNVAAGDYYITVDNQSSVSIIAESHLYACAGENCQDALNLPAEIEREEAEAKLTPRFVASAARHDCSLADSYELAMEDSNRLELFKIKNHVDEEIRIFRIDSLTAELTQVVALASGEEWIPTDAVYQDERFAVQNTDGECLGVLIAKESTNLGYYGIGESSCALKRAYSPKTGSTTNATITNNSDETLYVFYIYSSGGNEQNRGLFRRDSYPALAPNDVWEIPWRNGERVMLGSTDDATTAECRAAFEVASDNNLSYTGQ